MIEIVPALECENSKVWWTLGHHRLDRPAPFVELVETGCVTLTEEDATTFYQWARTVPGWHMDGRSGWCPEPICYADLERGEFDPDYWEPEEDVP